MNRDNSNVEPHSCEEISLPGQIEFARQHTGKILSQRVLADKTFAIRIDARELAEAITPGQFFMIRPERGTDPLLGRPFALYDTIVDDQGMPVALEFAYHVVGKMTNLMSEWESGENVVVWGPLGNGFPFYEGNHLLCVGGGIGYTPFLGVSRETLGTRLYGDSSKSSRATRESANPERRVTLCYGAQSQRYLADLSDFDDFDSSRFRIQISTDDGSAGHHGFVTDLVAQNLSAQGNDRPDGVYCCGPERMMAAVASICQAENVPCWLSLETPMACGFGACFSCVTKVVTDDGWDYRRTCIEGPVFPAESLAFQEN
ncbi:Dihydroorotate dehydrogenase B (NAD(+)), electron transfer subunit [Thalassoglobus neptunius]|uniref:Dihydroorotate dehydrogenase B (NAD(+)), electron transfer subunit n=1 Tax=Thalassoglobus neptunius TaxID=1938619 RepID=A0A5C5WH41_9PLAN|nr:dihydroorotate dehydrogenase electron transfer subunit [Thalassoglobus neptunius]TWT49970.1 Dihydroorotate dehydrogenase B (NAD(+)), electron transfer subunit [Thalassoglobus neptunius]